MRAKTVHWDMMGLTEDRMSDRGTNPRGIPYALFLENVEDYLTTREDVEPTLRNFQEMIS